MNKLWFNLYLVYNSFHIFPWTVCQGKSHGTHVSGKSSGVKPQQNQKINSIVIAKSPITYCTPMRFCLCPVKLSVWSSLPSWCSAYSCPYLLLFDALIDLGCCLLVGSKQTDDTSPFWVQDVPILVPNHLVQFQDPVGGSRRYCSGEDWKVVAGRRLRGDRREEGAEEEIWGGKVYKCCG